MARRLWRAGVPPVVTAFAGTGVAVWVNLATQWKNNLWAWVAVAALTAVVAAVAVLLERRRAAESGGSVEGEGTSGPSVTHSHIGRDNTQPHPTGAAPGVGH